jgi:hypothetical protein
MRLNKGPQVEVATRDVAANAAAPMCDVCVLV